MSPEILDPSENTPREIARILLDTPDCVIVDSERGFKFSSGIHSPIRVNCEKLFGSEDFEKVVLGLERIIRSTFFDFNLFCGVIRGGIPFAKSLGERFNVSVVARLGKNQDEARQALVSGIITPHSKGLVIEDVLTTGENVGICAKQTRSEGGRVLGVVAIFDYGFQKARDNLLNQGLGFWSLTNFNQLLTAAEELGKFTNFEIEKLKNWWGKTNQELSS